MGEVVDAESDAALASIAGNWAGQPLISDAVITSLKGRELEFVGSLYQNASWATNQPGYSRFIANLTKCVYKEAQIGRVTNLLDMIAAEPADSTWREVAMLNGISSFS